MKTKETELATLYMPERKDIDNLQVGDMAIDAFGKFRTVVLINKKGIDVNGKAFVCYYTQLGENNSSMSCSMKEDELQRTVACYTYTSNELREIEKEMRKS